MNRRHFLGRVLALAGASALAPSLKAAEASEQDRMQALVDDVLANPGKHPEIEARARFACGYTSWGMPGYDIPLGGITWTKHRGNNPACFDGACDCKPTT